AAIAVDLDQPPDVLPDLAAKVAFDHEVLVDVVADPDRLVVGELAGARVRVDAGRGQDLPRAGETNPKNVGKRDFHALIVRKVAAGETCQAVSPAAACVLGFRR